MSNDSLSIIIPTKDRFEHLSKCVKSILNQTVLPDEIIIVDGSVHENNEERIRLLFDENTINTLVYIKTEPNTNRQRNIGISKSSSELLTFLDDDTILDKNYIYYIKDFFNKYRNDNIGALNCKILDPESSNNNLSKVSIGNIIAKIFMLWCKGNGKFQLSGIPTVIDTNNNMIKKVDFIYGGNSTIPRYVFNYFLFDEHLPCKSQMDDDDFAFRVSRIFQNYWTPKAFLYHRTHYVNNNRYAKSKSFIINHFYLKNKNNPKKLINRIAFYWSVIGKIILEMYIALKNRNLSGVYGTFSGLWYVFKNYIKRERIFE